MPGRRRPSSPRPTFPTTLLLQAYVPILPKHIWAKYTLDQIGDPEADGFFKNEPPVVGTGPVPVASSGSRASSSGSPATRTTGARQGAADEVIFQHFAERGHDGPGARRPARSTTSAASSPTSSTRSKTEPNIRDRRGLRQRLHVAVVQHRRQHRRATAARPRRSTDPAFRDALGYAIDQQTLVDRSLGGYGVAGHDDHPAVPRQLARRAGQPARPSTSRRRSAGSTPPATRSTPTASALDKEGKPINLRLTWPDSEAEHATDAQFIEEWFGQLGIGVDAAVTEEGKLIDDLTGPPAGGAATRTSTCGAGSATPIPTSLLSFFTTERDRRRRATASTRTRTTTSCSRSSRRESDPAEAQGDHRRDAEPRSTTRRRTTSCTTTPSSHAYRTDKFGGWTNQPPDSGHAALRLRLAGYMS